MFKRTRFIACLCAVVLGLGGQVSGQQQGNAGTRSNELNDRERDGLIGPVRRVTVESTKITIKNGAVAEAPWVLREVTTYDPRGRKVDTVAYPIDGGALPGKEQYKYDDKGNIVEMQLRSPDGRLLSKESYKYQMDDVGNWKRMTTSLAVFEDGQLIDEPVEVTYRTITYFYSQEIAKLVAAAPTSQPTPAPANLNENSGPQTALGRQETGRPSPKSMAPNYNVRLTNSQPAAVPRNESKSTSSNQTLLASAPVPLAQRLSSPNLTVPTSDPQNSELNAPSVRPVGNIEGPTPNATIPSTGLRSGSLSTAKDPFHLGVSYLESGKPAEAIQALKEAIHRDPENSVAYMKLGFAYTALRQYNEAIAVYRMAIQIKPDLFGLEAYYQLGQAYVGIGKHSEAVAAFKQALQLSNAGAATSTVRQFQVLPSAVELHYSLGLAYHGLTKYKEAVRELQKVIELNPRLAEAHFGLAVCYLALGDRKSAEKQQKLLLPLNPTLAQKIAEALSSNRIAPPGVTEGMLGSKRMN